MRGQTATETAITSQAQGYYRNSRASEQKWGKKNQQPDTEAKGYELA